MSVENELPKGWVWTKIGDIANINPKLDSSILKDDTPVSFVPMAAVEAASGKIDTSNTRRFQDVKRGYTPFKDNDVLFAKITPCMENGKSAVAHSLISGLGFGSTEFHILRPLTDIYSQFLYYYISQESFRANAKNCMTGSAGQLRVPVSYLNETHFPLASHSEQQRIVEAIEQQFSRLDAGVALLRQAQKKLKLYRASVLKAAVEGELTAEWRAAHPDSEPASELLKRITAERRAKWEEEQLTKMREKGITPKDDKWKQAYKEPQEPDVNGLPKLPEGWQWTTLDQLTTYLRNGLSQRPNATPPGYRILRINAVRPMKVNLDEVRFLDLPETDVKAYFLEKGDILFTRYNGSLDLLGVAGMVGTCEQPTLHPDKLIRVKVQLGGISPSYIQLASNVGFSRAYVESKARTTAGQTGISGSDIRQMPIPLTRYAEQEQIVSLVEERISIINELETTIEKALKQAERQRQSILHQAFTGKLVPQDPNDEPASVLLERIQQEQQREQQEKPKTQMVQPKTVRSKKAPKMTKAVQIPDRPVEPIDAAGLTQGNLWGQEMDVTSEEQETIEHDLCQNVEA